MKTVSCPRCGASSVLTPQNKWRPFCSERCKMIDLGAWATESYRVPAEEQEPPGDESSSKPPGS
jgi:endogenous inhibitor of DNA gyrase (YacG/DUF329 family)